MSNDQALPQSERDRCTDWLHTCRTYLLLVANREMGNDLKSKEGASDVVQETLLQAHRDWGKFFGRTEAELRRWLRQILLHKIAHSVRRYRHIGRRRIDREISLDSGEVDDDLNFLTADQTSPGGRAVKREEEKALWAALDRLPERMRQAVLWRHHEACGFDELGRRLGCSNVAARKLWLRALSELQRELNLELEP
jgi:RNA polymerase sigma-70 factor (ECF subfamily)